MHMKTPSNVLITSLAALEYLIQLVAPIVMLMFCSSFHVELQPLPRFNSSMLFGSFEQMNSDVYCYMSLTLTRPHAKGRQSRVHSSEKAAEVDQEQVDGAG